MCQADAVEMIDEYVLETPRLRAFIEAVRAIQRTTAEPEAIIAAVHPIFADLLTDPTWLPSRYQEPSNESGMGRGIGTWLLYRATDGGLAFSALVVPAGMETPIHDHLAWGLVGLYRGEQAEDIFRRDDDGRLPERATLTLVEQRALRPGDLYTLLPATDIHRVRTTSEVTSVSLHLLGNDNGCIWRHRFHLDEQRVEPFKSGYVNVPCADDR